MGKHDRGAFGELLDEAKQIIEGDILFFECDFDKEDDDREKWRVFSGTYGSDGHGRTGEEALRDFLTKARRG
jgi:hypothetical protein